MKSTWAFQRYLLVGLVTMFPLTAFACAEGATTVTTPEARGTIAGRVLDTRNGGPVVGASIVTDPFLPTVTTDAAGRFQLSDLILNVEYTVTASAPGYIQSTVRVPVSRAQTFVSVEFTLTRFAADVQN